MSKVLKVKPLSKKYIEEMTLKIVQRHQPQMLQKLEPFDVERLFEIHIPKNLGIEVDYQPLALGVYGFTDLLNARCVVSSDIADRSQQSDAGRGFFRSTVAHECGHCFLHVHQIRILNEVVQLTHGPEHDVFSLRREVREIKPYCNPEWQAWRFARGLLLPLPCLERARSQGLSDKEISEMFDVTPRFLQVRMNDL
jgi:hypothetical protein